MHAIWRFVSALTVLLDRALAIVVSIALLADMVAVLRQGADPAGGRTWIGRGLDLATQHPQLAALAAGTLLLLNLNLIQFVLFSVLSAPGRAYIESRSPGGRTRVALTAIQNALRATAAQVPEIARSRIRVQKLGAHRFRVGIRYWVRDVHDAGNAAEHLRLVLKKRFSDLVVLDPRDGVEFNLDLAGIEGLVLRSPRRKELPPPARVRQDPGFEGPVYPVESEP